MIEAACEVTLDGQRREALALGRVSRNFSGPLACEIVSVIVDGRDRFGDVGHDELDAIRARLVNQYLTNVHPRGDAVEAG